MIGYLIDTSALWYLLRNRDTREAWSDRIASGAVRICEATRTEFLHSAKGPADRDELASHLDYMCALYRVPKKAWSWVDNAQYRLTQHGQHRGAGPIDLLLCATAVHYGLAVLHVDNDFPAVSRVIPEVEQRDIRQH